MIIASFLFVSFRSLSQRETKVKENMEIIATTLHIRRETTSEFIYSKRLWRNFNFYYLETINRLKQNMFRAYIKKGWWWWWAYTFQRCFNETIIVSNSIYFNILWRYWGVTQQIHFILCLGQCLLKGDKIEWLCTGKGVAIFCCTQIVNNGKCLTHRKASKRADGMEKQSF